MLLEASPSSENSTVSSYYPSSSVTTSEEVDTPTGLGEAGFFIFAS